MNLKNCTEKELLALVAAGDERAFRRLFDLYQPKIYSFALRVTRSASLSEDVAQEVFMKIWSARQELSTIDSFAAYLKTVARNIAVNQLKRIAKERLIINDLSSVSPSAARPVTGEEIIANELQRTIDEAIDALPRRQREVYLLHRREHMKQEDIALHMHLSLHTVKEYMKKALSAIRSRLERRVDMLVMAALEEVFR
ncbi:MAG: RNA polymerase sigma-70 factor [Odoribacteraceae bacterium]|nr:RNA polymerase sigma-70 factor [Odoribacteraceae bacterium]